MFLVSHFTCRCFTLELTDCVQSMFSRGPFITRTSVEMGNDLTIRTSVEARYLYPNNPKYIYVCGISCTC